jgi:hypothetical protein
MLELNAWGTPKKNAITVHVIVDDCSWFWHFKTHTGYQLWLTFGTEGLTALQHSDALKFIILWWLSKEVNKSCF